LKNKGITPTIEIIQVGDDPASSVYVRNKQKLCERMEINCIIEHFDASKSEEELLSLIHKLNNDKNINGILVQSPLPKHINENKVVQSIAAIKDVDCFNVENVGKL
jgi:methylenetetrahydrofolate dehydrogenase (NADP+)/methenyltetrahydrofolate cyclohydrolase